MNFLNIVRIVMKTANITLWCAAHVIVAAVSAKIAEVRCLIEEKNGLKIAKIPLNTAYWHTMF